MKKKKGSSKKNTLYTWQKCHVKNVLKYHNVGVSGGLVVKEVDFDG